MSWSKPITIKELLEKKCNGELNIPVSGIYLISELSWDTKEPPNNCKPIYVGQSKRLCQRIGDLIADLFGFYIENQKNHHSGGRKINDQIKNYQKIIGLHISWKSVNENELSRLEKEYIEKLEPKYNS